jgi:hypothetical protein
MIVLLYITTQPIYANNVPGYIVNLKNDTICGTIQVFDNIFLFRVGIYETDQNCFNSKVSFKPKNETRFRTFYPEDIREFEFRFKGVHYIFKSFQIVRNSIIASESNQNRFLCLLYKGCLELYQDNLFIPNHNTTKKESPEISFTDYFLFSPTKHLINVQKTDKYKIVRDLLAEYNFDEQFLKEMTDNLNFKDIKKILKLYDMWLSAK